MPADLGDGALRSLARSDKGQFFEDLRNFRLEEQEDDESEIETGVSPIKLSQASRSTSLTAVEAEPVFTAGVHAPGADAPGKPGSDFTLELGADCGVETAVSGPTAQLSGPIEFAAEGTIASTPSSDKGVVSTAPLAALAQPEDPAQPLANTTNQATGFFGEDYISQRTDFVFTSTGSQFGGGSSTLFEFDEFFGIGGDDPIGGPFRIGDTLRADLPFVGEVDLLTAELFGEVGAKFGINISSSLSSGSIDTVLPYETVVGFPDIPPGTAAGEVLDIFFGATFAPENDPDAGFTTRFPRLTFDLDLIADISGNLAARVGALDFETTIQVFDFDSDTSFSLISVDSTREQANGDADPINIFGVDTRTLIDNIPGVDEALNDAGEFAGIGIPLNAFFTSPEAKSQPPADTNTEGEEDETPEQQDPPEDPQLEGIDLGRIEIFVPNINTASTFVDGVFVTDPTRKAEYTDNPDGSTSVDVVDDLDADGNNLGEGNRDDLAALTLDLDGILTYATGGFFPPLEIGKSASSTFGGDNVNVTFDAAFELNLFDVELKAAFPLEQEFTLTPEIVTQLQFFEADDDGNGNLIKGAAKAVDIFQQQQVIRFDENGVFSDSAVEARLKELADLNVRAAQDVDLFIDFSNGIPGAFTGQTGSIAGRMIISRDGGATFTELFTNAGETIAESAPTLGENQNIDITLAPGTVLGYRIFNDTGTGPSTEDFIIAFDETETVYLKETDVVVAPVTETPFLDELTALNLVYDADDTFVEVVTKAVPIVTNRTGLEFDLSLLLEALSASASFTATVNVGPLTLDAGIEVDFGPILDEEFPLLNLDIIDLFNDSFVLEDTVNGVGVSSFVLGDPGAAPDFGDAIVGTSGNDTLDGTEGDDVFIPLAGEDTINAFGGDDTVAVGPSAVAGDRDTIIGGEGFDTLDLTGLGGQINTNELNATFGSTSVPFLAAGERRGVVNFSGVKLSPPGSETIFSFDLVAGSGQHTTSGFERIIFTDLADTIRGLTDTDAEIYEGRGGNDEILFGDGTDMTLLGQDGDDIFRTNGLPDAAAVLDGGTGHNYLFFTGTSFSTIDLELGELQSGTVIRNIQSVATSAGNQTLLGDESANTLDGGAGDDTLNGRGGNDRLLGADDDDVLIGGAGADELDGGAGLDTADYSSAATSVFIDMDNDGAARGFRGEAQGDVLISIERVVGSDFEDILIGNDASQTLEGGAGDDRLAAQNGADTLIGGEGNDLLLRGEVETFGQFVTGNNLFDGENGFDFAAFELTDRNFSGSVSGTGRYRDLNSRFLQSDEVTTKDRSLSFNYSVQEESFVRAVLGEAGLDGSAQVIGPALDQFIRLTGPIGSGHFNYKTANGLGITTNWRDETKTLEARLDGNGFGGQYSRGAATGASLSIGTITASDIDESVLRDSDFSGSVLSINATGLRTSESVLSTDILRDIEAIIGSENDDEMYGNSQNNAFYGNGGNDYVEAGGGDDFLSFGEGQALSDVIGFPGNNPFFKVGDLRPGDPTLVARLIGLDREDESAVVGQNLDVGDVNVFGGADEFRGSFLWGQAGTDTLDMRFDRGFDFFPVGNFASEAIVDLNVFTGTGTDAGGNVLEFGEAFWINPSNEGDLFNFKATLFGIENIIGSRNDDQLTGDKQANKIEGMDGADVMDGDAGFDMVSYERAEEGVLLNLRADGADGFAIDNTRAGLEGTGHAEGDLATNFEAVLGSDFGDTVILEGAAQTLTETVPVFFSYQRDTGFGGTETVFDTADVENPAYDPATLGFAMVVNTGDGTDHVEVQGLGSNTINLGDGDDTATIRNIGQTVDGGAGDDVITVLAHEKVALGDIDDADRKTLIEGGSGIDTVVFSGGDYRSLEITDAGVIVTEIAVPELSPTSVEVIDGLFSTTTIDLTDRPQFISRQNALAAEASFNPITYELTGVEFVEINGERIRVDNPDPIVDADRTVTLIEDQIDIYDLGVNGSSADLNAGATFEILSLPQTAAILLPDDTPVFVGDVIAAVDLASLRVAPGQNFDPGVEAVGFLRIGDAIEDALSQPLPDPVRGVALNITAPVDPAFEVEVDTSIQSLALNLGPTSNQYASVSRFDGFSSPQMTYEFLYKSDGPTPGNTDKNFYASYSSSVSNNSLLLEDFEINGALQFRIVLVSGSDTSVMDTGVPSAMIRDGETHRFSLAVNADANEVRLFIDGNEVYAETDAALAPLVAGGTLVIGQEQDAPGGGFDPNQVLHGEIADIRVWDTYRTEAEIRETAFAEIEDPSGIDGLVINWRPDADNPNAIVDVLGGQELGLSHSPGFSRVDPPVPNPVEVINTVYLNPVNPGFGAGSDLINTDQYLGISNTANMPTDALTLEWLFRAPVPFETTGPDQIFLSYAVPDTDNEILIYGLPDGANPNLELRVNNILIQTGVPTSSVFDGDVHRMSYTIDSVNDEVAVFIDGVEVFRETGVAIAPITSGGSTAFGQEYDAFDTPSGFNANQILQGEIGDIRIWDRARTEAEIAADAFVEIADPVSEAGLVANWRASADDFFQMFDAAGGPPLGVFNEPAVLAIQSPGTPVLPDVPEIETVGAGDALTITVDGVPTDGTVFYLAPDPAFLALGLTVLEEVVVAVGDQLTPDQLEGLFFRADKDFSGDPGAFTYTVRDDVSHRDLSSTAQADIFGATGGAARDGVASQTISFDVIAANDAPDVARLLFPISPGGDLAGQVSVRDAEGDEILVNLIEAPAFGTVVVNPDGSFTYQQSGAIDFAGARFVEDRFKVQAVETVAPPPGASGSVLPGAASAVETQVIRIINPDFQQAIVFDPTDPDIYFDENGDPINLGGLGTDDRIVGHAGVDGLFGFGGHDTLAGLGEGDTLDGGSGLDTADYSASGEAVVVASDGAFAIGGDAAGDVLTDIENLLGSAFADFLRGDGQANVLTGGAGADYIQGRGGDDTLNGGENDDLLEPGAGADTVDGGAGQDLLSALDAAGPVTINLGNVALSSAGYADKTLISIEGVLGVAGFGNTLVGGGGEDLLIGGDVADSIAGAGGADILLGLGGADTISGGAGDDLILGLEGDDVLTGDAGRDLFLFEPGDGADVVTDFELPVGGAGFEDRLFFSGLGLTFADLDIAEVGGDVVIGYGTNPAAFDGSVTVEGVTLAELVPGGAQPDWILVF